MSRNAKKVVFFSSCLDTWGGSEELWSQSAELLARKKHEIHIFKINVDFSHPRIKKLSELGCRITDLNGFLPFLPSRLLKLLPIYKSSHPIFFYIKYALANRIKRLRPDLFIISQGANFDGLFFIKNCFLDKTPYIIISQKATDSLWAADRDREWMKKIWQNAMASFFVSEHNLRITQEQFAVKLKNAEVVRNPFLTVIAEPLTWNFAPSDKIKLACVGRLFPLDKGQDILLRILAIEKWRRRNIEVTFFGGGSHENGLKELANYLKLDNVRFKGHVSDIVSIWKEHQALVLPSRAEGMPLVLVEAMMCGRPAIVTNVGGNAEIVENNVTGFTADSADEKSFDEAMERSWARIAEWETIGKFAAQKVRALFSDDPAEAFSQKLCDIIETDGISR